MKKPSIIVLSCSESSDDETEKAMPKIDKEELRKYLQNSDEDESPTKTSPKKSKKLLPVIITFKINKLNLSKKTYPQNISSKVQKKAKKLGATSCDVSHRKNNKYMVVYANKKIHFGSANAEDFITHKDPVRQDKYLTKAKKVSNKDGQLTHQIPSYPNYWSVNLLN